MEETTALKIIDEICKERNIELTKLSFGWIRELKKDGKIRHIVRNAFDLNPASATNIVNDKYATYEVLKENNINILKHIMLFNPITRKEFAESLEKQVDLALKEFGGQVVIKANNSCQGKDVFLLNDKNVIIEKVKELFKNGADGVSACPYKEIEAEYRVIYLDGNIEFVYKKEKPFVIGNGKNTVKELLGENVSNLDLCENIDLNKIPANNEKVIASWKHNLCLGAKPKLVLENDKYVEQVRNLALAAGKATNVKFASIDISQTANDEVFVMEINGAVCMSNFAERTENGIDIIKNIYSKAIDKMFE